MSFVKPACVTFCFSMNLFPLGMAPSTHLHIQTRRGGVYPHVRGRWVRAGGTCWAHQAQSITQWQGPLEHGGASVEPQVRMYWLGCDSFYLIWDTARVGMDVIFCMQGILELSHTQTPFGGFSHEILPSALPWSLPYLTSLRSGLAGLTSSTTPELSLQVNSVNPVTLQTHNTRTRCKQWPCTNSQSVNRKREVWKDKVQKLDIHWGPAGSRPRFRNHLPVAASCWTWTKAIAEECLKFLWTYLSPCVTRSSWWMCSTDMTSPR